MRHGHVAGEWYLTGQVFPERQLLYFLRFFEVQELSEAASAVFEVGYVDGIDFEVDICFKSECHLGCEEVVGAGLAIRVEEWRDGLIGHELQFVAFRRAHVDAVDARAEVRSKGESPDLESQLSWEALEARKSAVLGASLLFRSFFKLL